MNEPLPADLLVIWIVGAALLGLLFGSFLNVCIYRIPRDLSVVAPRSFCPECGEPIAWYDNVPVLSWALLRGVCRHCQNRIGLRYPLVELMTAALLAWVAARYGCTTATLKWVVFEALLVALFWIDLEERLLPDELTLGGAVVGLCLAVFVMVPGLLGELLLSGPHPVWRSLLNAVLGGTLLAFPLWFIGAAYRRLRKREGLGFGDVKLVLLIGVYLGFEKGVIALMIGAVAGSVLGIIYIVLTRKNASTYELPLGSFLCAGAMLIPLVAKF
jgi:leader peptidase (prepilin peptidase)/N-methyltransferase